MLAGMPDADMHTVGAQQVVVVLQDREPSVIE